MTEHDKLVEDCASAIRDEVGSQLCWLDTLTGKRVCPPRTCFCEQAARAALAIAVERCAQRAENTWLGGERHPIGVHIAAVIRVLLSPQEKR